jgi:hypothetical protein
VRGSRPTEGPKLLTPLLSQPKSESDFGLLKLPNSSKPEFGWEKEQTEFADCPEFALWEYALAAQDGRMQE